MNIDINIAVEIIQNAICPSNSPVEASNMRFSCVNILLKSNSQLNLCSGI